MPEEEETYAPQWFVIVAPWPGDEESPPMFLAAFSEEEAHSYMERFGGDNCYVALHEDITSAQADLYLREDTTV